ncbi:MAG: penicillin acylase family protein, partial [Dehalococcoidia bacterium]
MALARMLRLAGVGLALAAGVGSAAVLYLLRRSLPATRGRLRLKGLRSRVEVLRDHWGVPHIYASNLPDLMFAFGYVQAQDRFWQLEFYRRLAMGTLAEVLGESALEIDRLTRRVGFRGLAERDWSEASAIERDTLEAFSAGINACLDSSRLPVEFTVLRYRPQRWRPLDSIAFGRFLAWNFSGNWDSEILRSWTIERFGAEVTQDVEPTSQRGAPLVVPPGAEARGAGPSLDEEFRKV